MVGVPILALRWKNTSFLPFFHYHSFLLYQQVVKTLHQYFTLSVCQTQFLWDAVIAQLSYFWCGKSCWLFIFCFLFSNTLIKSMLNVRIVISSLFSLPIAFQACHSHLSTLSPQQEAGGKFVMFQTLKRAFADISFAFVIE